MFGFLKQKISDFGNKLQKTIAGKEEEENKKLKKTEQEKETKKEEKETEKKGAEKKHAEGKQAQEKNKEQKIEENGQETKQDEEKHGTDKKETTEEKKETEHEKQKKKGLFEKLFGLGKKEEAPRKKTREELAEEMEKKMFEDIEKEIAQEKKPEPRSQDLAGEKLEEDREKEKEIETKRTEKSTLEKEIKKEEEKPKREALDEIEKELKEEEDEIEELEEQEEQLIQKQFGETEEEKTTEVKEVWTGEIEETKEKPRGIEIKTIEEEKRELKAKVGVAGGIKGFLFGGIEITEKEINDLLWELEMSLLESDVEQDAAGEIVRQIKQKLVGQKTNSKNINEFLKEKIKEILEEMMKTEKINVLAEAKKAKKEGKPYKILMLGPNGAGKTTSIAKLVHYLEKNGLTSIIAAGDTFRAGAIHQIEEHAKKLNVRVIKQQYGADPAAVSFDAIKAAEAGKIDAVIIDSAGRQETNKNLMEELRKIERIAKPNLKIFVGEAYVGQGLLEQVKEFEEMIGLDGFILTKIDTDAKGGTAISLTYKTKKPIIFVGTGQGYDDFEEFTPKFIIERII
jgi:fused signal recognition particle receptor